MTSETPSMQDLDPEPQAQPQPVEGSASNGWKAGSYVEAAGLAPESILDLSKIPVPDKPNAEKLPLDEAFIENGLTWEDGEARVAEHHRHRFRSWFAGAVEQMVQNRDLINLYVEALQHKTRFLSRRVKDLDEFVRHDREEDVGKPWSAFAIAGASLLGLFSLALLAMGVNTLATYLKDSGIVMFVEQPAVAYLLSALNIGLAGLLKIGFSWCASDQARRTYFASLWGVGLVSGLTWLVTFSIIFPNIGAQGIDDVIANLENQSSSREAILQGLFVCSQLIGEICVAAAMWVHLEGLIDQHAPLRTMEKNPEHRAYLKALSEWTERLRAAVAKRAALEGRLSELRHLEATYVARATAELRRRQASRMAQDYGLKS